MAAIIEQRSDIATAPGVASPGQRILADDDHRSRSMSDSAKDDSGLWRGSLIGAALGFVVLTVTITLIGTLGGFEPLSALGLGAFVGLWGGCGFGMMMGGVVAMQTIERRERRAAEVLRRT